MNTEIKFKTLEELYNRLLPALRSLKKELTKDGLSYITEVDIWNYLKNYKWLSSKDLDLSCMVNDIFSINKEDLNEYVKIQLKNIPRTIDGEEI